MYPKIFGIDSYIIFAALGFAAAFTVGFFRRKKYSYEIRDLVAMLLMGGAGLVIGAQFLFFLTMVPEIIGNFSWELLADKISHLGFVFYGGLIGAMAGLAILAKLIRRSATEMLNFVIPSFAAFHAVGRIGCFLDGCCHGVRWEHGFECNADFLCFPIQLVEAAGIAVIFVILMLIERYNNKTNRKIPMLPTYFLLYGILRFVDEFWRGDVLRGVTTVTLNYSTSTYTGDFSFDISTSQIISVILIAYSAVALIGFFKKKPTDSKPTAADNEE